MIEPGTTVRSVVTRGGVEAIEQFYRFESGSRSILVDQIWHSLTDTNARGGCSFVVTPRACSDLRFRARRSASGYDFSVDVRSVDAVMRSNGEICSTVALDKTPVLFDFDDPLLDWINAFTIIGLQQGESLQRVVHYIDLRSGSIARRCYTFTWLGETVTIIKSPDPRHDCRLWISGESFRLRQAESGGMICFYE